MKLGLREGLEFCKICSDEFTFKLDGKKEGRVKLKINYNREHLESYDFMIYLNEVFS